jgi:haloalkane dehalogenase
MNAIGIPTAAAALAGTGLPSASIEVDGVPLSFVDAGRGPVMLFVHGAPAWSFTWRGVIARLRDRFRCIAPDLPGFGLSPARQPRPSLRTAAAAVETLLQGLDLRDVVLVANDTGGPVGFGAAARRPERFAGLVAVSTCAFPLDDFLAMRAAVWTFSSAPARVLNRLLNLVPRAVTSFGTPGRRWTDAERAAYLKPFADRALRDRNIRLLRALLDERDFLRATEDGLRRIADRPLLAIFGEKDAARRAGFPARFARLFPDFTEHVVPRAMHFPHEDDPDDVAATIDGWFRTRLGAGGSARRLA